MTQQDPLLGERMEAGGDCRIVFGGKGDSETSCVQYATLSQLCLEKWHLPQ